MIPFSVVIPAHDEAGVIGRLLAALSEAEEGEVETVVVCNGCSDGTADLARTFAGVRVVEIPEASKIAALNRGDEAASVFPRFYIDADVEVGLPTLRRCAAELRSGPALCVGPTPRFDFDGVSPAVRAFYGIWEQVPYFTTARIGMAYGLSAAGRARFDAFPPITADDQFVAQQFTDEERRCLEDCSFTVHPPRTVRALVANRTRVHRGNRELAASGLSPNPPPGGRLRALAQLAGRPANWPGLAVYLPVNALAKRRATRHHEGWERDDTSRPAGRPAGGNGFGYVVSHYPARSHTFVLREVRMLRALGTPVETFSIHAAPPEDLLAPVDREEAASTVSLRPVGAWTLLRAHLGLMATSPEAYLSVLALALRVSPRGARARLWQLFYFAEAVLLHAHARRRGVRRLHAHLANAGADVAWLAAEIGQRCEPAAGWSWSFTMHGPTEFYAIERFNLARKVAAARTVVCISEFCRSQLMLVSDPADWPKLQVVHCGVDTQEFAYHRTRRGDGRFRILCVGRLTPEKGQHVLLDAMAELIEQGEQVSLTLAGWGPSEPALRRRAEQLGITDAVEFAGAVGQDRLAALFADADAFCLPSFAEGVPVVLMEAMAVGVPVVTTPVAGIPELVRSGENGWLVPPGRPDLLAATLQALLRDPDAADALTGAARRTVEKEFDLATNCRRLLEVLHR